MKKTALIIFCVIHIMLTGCKRAGESTNTPPETDIKDNMAAYGEMKAKVNEQCEKSIEASDIKSVQPFDELKKYLMFHFDVLMSAEQPTLYDFEKKFGLECVRSSENNLYVIYKTDNGGLFYCWFLPLDAYEGNFSHLGLMNTAFVQKNLSVAAFSGIKADANISEVTKIDPVAALYSEAFDGYKSYSIPKFTRHLLSDGLVFITYEKNTQGEYVVKEIEINPDFEYDIDFHGSDPNALPLTMTYKYLINQNDYI